MIANVVIAGGGIGGVSTAAALRGGGFDGDISVIDPGEVPYDRPPLSKDFLAGRASLTDIALQSPNWYDENKIRLITGRTATALRADAARVECSDGTTLPADRVVLATGAKAVRPPVPGVWGPRVHVLRTVDDAVRLRTQLRAGNRVLVVGAGLIGAELASTAMGLGCEVMMVDPVAPPLAAAVGPLVAEWLHGVNGERGVPTARTTVHALRDNGNDVVVDLAGDAGREAFDVVVLGVGATPDTALAETAGIDLDGGILVDRTQTSSYPAVLAVGDAARMRKAGIVLPRSEHWDAAQRDGRRAAARILGADPPAESAPWFWTDRHGLHVEVVGAMAAADRTIVRGELGAPRFSVFGLVGDHVVGAVAVGDPMAVRAARRLIDRAVVVDPARLGDPGVDLKRLVRG